MKNSFTNHYFRLSVKLFIYSLKMVSNKGSTYITIVDSPFIANNLRLHILYNIF